MSYGHYWVFPGFAKSFKRIIGVYGSKRAIEIWDKNCRAGYIPTGKNGFQKRFRWKRIPKPKLLIKPTPRYYVYRDGTLRLMSGRQLGFKDYCLFF